MPEVNSASNWKPTANMGDLPVVIILNGSHLLIWDNHLLFTHGILLCTLSPYFKSHLRTSSTDFLGPFAYQIHSLTALKNRSVCEKNSGFSSQVNVTISKTHIPLPREFTIKFPWGSYTTPQSALDLYLLEESVASFLSGLNNIFRGILSYNNHLFILQSIYQLL